MCPPRNGQLLIWFYFFLVVVFAKAFLVLFSFQLKTTREAQATGYSYDHPPTLLLLYFMLHMLTYRLLARVVCSSFVVRYLTEELLLVGVKVVDTSFLLSGVSALFVAESTSAPSNSQ